MKSDLNLNYNGKPEILYKLWLKKICNIEDNFSIFLFICSIII